MVGGPGERRIVDASITPKCLLFILFKSIRSINVVSLTLMWRFLVYFRIE